MLKTEITVSKKPVILAAVGFAAKLIGNICLIAALLGAVKEIRDQIKQILIRELSK